MKFIKEMKMNALEIRFKNHDMRNFINGIVRRRKMGLNLDLNEMLGVTLTTTCPKCHNEVNTFTNDYDIECGTPFLNRQLLIDCYCETCSNDFQLVFDIVLKKV